MTVLRALRIKGGLRCGHDVGEWEPFTFISCCDLFLQAGPQPLMLSEMKFVSVLREGVKPIYGRCMTV